MGNDQKNFFVMVTLCALIFFGGDFLVQKWRTSQTPPPPVSQTTASPPPGSQSSSSPAAEALPSLASISSLPVPLLPREQALMGPRVRLETPTLKGSINLKGAVFDDLVLKGYRQTPSPHSPEIVLLCPTPTPQSYTVGFAWGQDSETGTAPSSLPPREALWKADHDLLTPDAPVTLSWENGQGLHFSQKITIDAQARVTVVHQVTNHMALPQTLRLRGQISRVLSEKQDNNFLLYEGPLGEFGGKFQEISYENLDEKGPRRFSPSPKTWMGITDKYWLVAFFPEGECEGLFDKMAQGSRSFYNSGFLAQAVTLLPHTSHTQTVHFFAGAKVLALLDAYEKQQGVSHFDLAVDFGWFYFLTKPIFYALTWLKGFTGNFGLAILLFTVLLKLAFFPLTNRSYHTMARMKRLQPELEKLQERYKDDPVKLNQERLAFYKKQKVNPISGCLPMLLQMPAFFALYKVLFISIEMRHAPFWGWIHDLSAPDPTNLFTLFGLLPLSLPPFLHLGLWPLMMGATMFLQQRLNPPPVDPIQRKMFLYIMPGMFTFLSGQFAAGLVIYWTWNNLLSMAQQWMIMRLDAQKGPPRPQKEPVKG